MKYRKKPVVLDVVDAIQYKGESGPVLEWATEDELNNALIHFTPNSDITNREVVVYRKYSGMTVGRYGDWIVRDERGRLWIRTNSEFETKYEPCEGDTK